MSAGKHRAPIGVPRYQVHMVLTGPQKDALEKALRYISKKLGKSPHQMALAEVLLYVADRCAGARTANRK